MCALSQRRELVFGVLLLLGLAVACTAPTPTPTEELRAWRPVGLLPPDGGYVLGPGLEVVFRYPAYAQIGYYFAPPLVTISDGAGGDPSAGSRQALALSCWPIQPELAGELLEVTCQLGPLELENGRLYEWQVVPGGCDANTCQPSPPQRFIWAQDRATAATPVLLEPADKAATAATPDFDWSDVLPPAGAPAPSYRLEIFADDELVLQVDDLTESELTLAADQALPPDRPYLWRVSYQPGAEAEPIVSKFSVFYVAP